MASPQRAIIAMNDTTAPNDIASQARPRTKFRMTVSLRVSSTGCPQLCSCFVLKSSANLGRGGSRSAAPTDLRRCGVPLFLLPSREYVAREAGRAGARSAIRVQCFYACARGMLVWALEAAGDPRSSRDLCCRRSTHESERFRAHISTALPCWGAPSGALRGRDIPTLRRVAAPVDPLPSLRWPRTTSEEGSSEVPDRLRPNDPAVPLLGGGARLPRRLTRRSSFERLLQAERSFVGSRCGGRPNRSATGRR